ncbi:MAG: endonuclease/exonuclease/phosphatase family protein [Verrucomicrobiaceae bacterium]|nr:endonuclease/exonuclease/phosphatase family protein [Verrucomicrobiaceae bacterium]
MHQKLDEIARGVGARMQSSEGRKELCLGCRRLLLRLNFLAFFMYAGAIFVAFAGMRYLGEQNMFFAFCIYWPPLVWFLPAVGLAFTSVCLLDWRTFVGLVVVSGTVILLPLGWRPPRTTNVNTPPPAGKLALTILTNNRGQDKGEKGESIRTFMNTMKPDIMAFQESAGMAPRYKADPGYADFPHAAGVGEFVLLSKHPIIAMELVPLRPEGDVAGGSWPVVAARFVVEAGGRRVVIYNVHAPTPRDTLRYYMRGAFLYGIFGLPGTPWAARKQEGEKGWHQRISLMEALLERARQEKEPTVLTGDFNMPECGYLHSVVSSVFADSHSEAGEGFGFTFPGTTRNPLSFGGPWMRIDHIFFAPDEWRCIWSLAEPQRKSQHRAVVARLILR